MPKLSEYRNELSRHHKKTQEVRRNSAGILKQIVDSFREHINASWDEFSVTGTESITKENILEAMSHKPAGHHGFLVGDTPVYQLTTRLTIDTRSQLVYANLVFSLCYMDDGIKLAVGSRNDGDDLRLQGNARIHTEELDEFLDGLSRRILNSIQNAPPDSLDRSIDIDYPAGGTTLNP